MPTTIIVPTPNAPFGPGYDTQVVTTTIGPFSNPAWGFQFIPDDTHDGEVITWTMPIDDPHVPTTVPFPKANWFGFPRPNLRSGSTGHLKVSLAANGGVVVEEATVAVVSNFQDGAIAQLQETVGTGQALTPLQAQQVEETHASVFPAISLDALTTKELTNGPQGDFVAAQLGAWIMGVIVRIATVPPEFKVNTADGNYWMKSLAVVRIYRGSDLWKRVPVHTSSKLIDFTEEGLVSAIAANLPLQWLLQISIQVSFAPGVTGQVFLMSMP